MSDGSLVIALPVWGRAYVDLCVRYVIPALRIAIDRGARVFRRDVRFIVHTDEPQRIAEALVEFEAHFYAVPVFPNPYHAFAQCHRDAIAAAPLGSVLMMLNADIVVSAEAIEVAERAFLAGAKALVAVAMRCRSDVGGVPVGAGGRAMLEWFWKNRHPIATDCLWGTGRTMLPTNLFFERGDNVVLHCFHLYPVLLIKDRELAFGVTIDDDLLRSYQDSEVAFVTDRECAFLELSSPSKGFRSGAPLSVAGILALGRSFSPRHVSLFRRQVRIIGEEPIEGVDGIVGEIASGCLALWHHRERRHQRHRR